MIKSTKKAHTFWIFFFACSSVFTATGEPNMGLIEKDQNRRGTEWHCTNQVNVHSHYICREDIMPEKGLSVFHSAEHVWARVGGVQRWTVMIVNKCIGNPATDFVDSLTFPTTPPADWHFWLNYRKDCRKMLCRDSGFLVDELWWIWWLLDFLL